MYKFAFKFVNLQAVFKMIILLMLLSEYFFAKQRYSHHPYIFYSFVRLIGLFLVFRC